MIYGPHGIGKSTFGAQFPKPVFIPCEDGLNDIDVAAFPVCKTFVDAEGPLVDLCSEDPDLQHKFKTVVVDTVDWLERLIFKAVCDQHGIEHIGELDFGKGYLAAQAKLSSYLNNLDLCRKKKGMHVVLLAHSQIKTYESPTSSSYDRYMPKMQDKMSALIQEWCDEVFFTNYKVFTTEEKEGFNKKRARALGKGERVLYTSEMPTHIAKNRMGLPDTLPLDYSVYEKYLKENYKGN